MIYVIRDTLSGHVKIGLSDKPWDRLGKMQSDTPGELQMVSAMEGGLEEEQALHARFAAQRYRGEWFRAESHLAVWIASLPAVTKPAPRRKPKTPLLDEFVLATGVPAHTAYSWILRDSIPSRYWRQIMDAGLLTWDQLVGRARHSGKVTVTAAPLEAQSVA